MGYNTNDLQQIINDLKVENERLMNENLELKKGQSSIYNEEMERMYAEYYSSDNVIHI